MFSAFHKRENIKLGHFRNITLMINAINVIVKASICKMRELRLKVTVEVGLKSPVHAAERTVFAFNMEPLNQFSQKILE